MLNPIIIKNEFMEIRNTKDNKKVGIPKMTTRKNNNYHYEEIIQDQLLLQY